METTKLEKRTTYLRSLVACTQSRQQPEHVWQRVPRQELLPNIQFQQVGFAVKTKETAWLRQVARGDDDSNRSYLKGFLGV